MSRVEIVKAKSGHDTAIYYPTTQDPLLLHSNSNPIKEAEEIILRYTIEGKDVVIIYGCGMGYHIMWGSRKRLLDNSKSNRTIYGFWDNEEQRFITR